ncbi:U-box domain-containing protein 26 [Hibiscus syriacus]|uniref:U-box domain-containing protein n=1 Tax=Hibiscus syriacus TaxID=106335 RepID=A0A6A2YA81_HIBSY|nr:U-box domain-containing protein 26-like [Hibiscus syriacus]KAE8667454.1 U-box domain-containing protein 26 [Hibiscus syriacus]
MPGTTIEPLDLVGLQVPYHFRCPISLELMRDPVTVCTGQTYDRSSIESWVATGNTTCPVTRVPLTDFTFIPNHTLRRLIQDWCVANQAFGIQRIPTPKQPADPTMVRTLLGQASSASNPFQSRLSALRRLKGLARDSEKNRCVISSLNVREMLINILFSDTGSGSSDLNVEALAVLVMFQLCESDCESIASDPERVMYLSHMLFHSSIEVRVNSALLIEIVLSGTSSSELRAQISNVDEIFEGVTDILRNLNSYQRALKTGIRALFTLCLVRQTRQKAVQAGAPETLIDRLAELDKCEAEQALATIDLLCRIPSGCSAFASHALTVPLLVKTILKISDRATEYAAGALMALCSESEQCQRDAVNAGILTQLLLLVQSDCTERGKRKAQMLLKLLRDSWPEDCTGNSEDFGCSEIVPF